MQLQKKRTVSGKSNLSRLRGEMAQKSREGEIGTKKLGGGTKKNAGSSGYTYKLAS